MLDTLDSLLGPGWRWVAAGILAALATGALGHACALETAPDPAPQVAPAASP
jgi:hypothetical protein